MTLNPALARTLLMAASLGIVVPMVAQTRPARPGVNAPVTEEELEVTGVEIPRANGQFLGLAIEGNALVLRFYDEEKKPLPADVARGTARWNAPRKTGQERTVLNPADGGQLLRSPAVVRPPHTFHVFLTLLDADGNALENHVVDIREQS